MSGHHTYEESIKKVYKGLILLGAVTLIEVLISLFGKGHLFYKPTSKILLIIIALALITFSVYKAYFIIYEFMHMHYETKSLGLTVLLPMLLLVWGIVAFFQDGNAWGIAREEYKEHTGQETNEGIRPVNADEEYIINSPIEGE